MTLIFRKQNLKATHRNNILKYRHRNPIIRRRLRQPPLSPSFSQPSSFTCVLMSGEGGLKFTTYVVLNKSQRYAA